MTLVVGSFTPSVLLAVARRTGRLEAASLDVTESLVQSSPAQFRSMIEGDIHVALTSPDNVVAYRFSAGNPLGVTLDARIVAAVDRGMGLGLYGRPGFTAQDLRGARVAVDVPTSGFALAMYALTDSLGVSRDEYDVAALGSTPKRLEALRSGVCDATMLNAGNELLADEAGMRLLASVGDVCAPYLGTVVAVLGEDHLDAATRLSRVLRDTAREICGGRADQATADEARARIGLSEQLARRYVERMKSRTEGLVLEDDVDLVAMSRIVDLRRRYLPDIVDGTDVLDGALDPGSGLVVASATRAR